MLLFDAAAMVVAAASPTLLLNSSSASSSIVVQFQQQNQQQQHQLHHHHASLLSAVPEVAATTIAPSVYNITEAAHEAFQEATVMRSMIVDEVLFPNKYIIDDRKPQFVVSVPVTASSAAGRGGPRSWWWFGSGGGFGGIRVTMGGNGKGAVGASTTTRRNSNKSSTGSTTASSGTGSKGNASNNNDVYGITSFDPVFWLQSIFLVCLQTLFNVCVACFVYKHIVKRVYSNNNNNNENDDSKPAQQKDSGDKNNKNEESTTTTTISPNDQNHYKAYVIGYGIIIPMLLCVPWLGIKLLDLQNIAFILLVAGATPSLLILRCMEAMHGTLPQFALDDRTHFILYYATTLGFAFNFDLQSHQIVKVTRREFIGRTLKFFKLFAYSTVCYSVLLPYQFKLFPSKSIHSPLDTLYYGNLLNNLVVAALFIVCLDTGSTGLSLVASLLTGYSTVSMNDKPLIASKSPSEFWGKRWNRIFAGCLKSGIYLPARQQFKCSRTISAMLTFLVSGLLHEYILLLIMSSSGNYVNLVSGRARHYTPNFGNQLLFFAWSGVVLMMEGRVRKRHPAFIKWMDTKLCQPLLTTITMMTALPLLHMFMDEYVASGMFQHVSLGFPKIVYLGKS